jgi:two-component system NtrC family sensor kinase
MKRNTKIFFLLLLPFFALSQSQKRELDSLHLVLKNTVNDTIKMTTIKNMVGYYVESNRDSTMTLAENGINIAKRIRQPLWVADFLILKAYLMQKDANLALSLRLCNEALALANDENNEKNVFIPKDDEFADNASKFRRAITLGVFHQLGNIYLIVGDKEKAIEYFKKEIQIAFEINAKSFGITSNTAIGSIFLEMDQLDSAFIYSKRALENINLYHRWVMYEGIVLNNIGDIYFRKGLMDSAKYYFQTAITVNRKQSNVAGEIESNNSLARLYEKQKQPDSMLCYASAALHLASQLKSEKTIAISSEQVALAWKMLGNTDTALTYFIISKKVGDSLQKNINDKLLQFQNQNFEDQVRLENEAQQSVAVKNKIRTTALLVGLGLLSILAVVFYRNNRQKQKANKVLETTLSNLKSTQSQLIQSEKMASLGELTAGIAHEIQNPLNFVNNFSEVNTEILEELKAERLKPKGERNEQLQDEIINDVTANEEKINHHGKRADAIVKGMLQHSQSRSGTKEPTDINALCDEYLRLSYHGLRAKDKLFNATLKTDFDESIGLIKIIPQDIGRVILNLFNNAFYAVNEKKKSGNENYEPTVSVITKRINDKIEIKVSDNGNGIPQKIIDKIFQPFFTTKPTGQGTGLGLSLSYDIIKAHGGEIKVETNAGEARPDDPVGRGTAFIIQLPLV